MDSALLLQIVELGISEIVPAEQLVVKLKNYFTLNPDVKISIQNLQSEAIQADDDTLAQIAAWQTAHGLPVTVQPPPAQVAQMPAPSSPAASQAAPSSTGGVGDTGDHGEIGDIGSNKPAST